MDPNDPLIAESQQQVQPVHILYVMGVGRSGSTMLDTILGNHPSIESVGELYQLALQGGLQGQQCACGRRADACPFWDGVRQQWTRRVGATAVDRYAELAAEFEQRQRWIPFRSSREMKAMPGFDAYARHTRALYESIREVSGNSLIVDSSKEIRRALVLAEIPGVEVRVIHLVRDLRGVAWSMKKKVNGSAGGDAARSGRPRPAWRTAAGWIRRNLEADSVRTQLAPHQSIRVRYEDYVARPEQVLHQIGRFAGVDLSPVVRSIRLGQPLQVGHTVAGNRLRMAGRVSLKPDLEWTVRLSPADRFVCWAMAGWLMARYGYTRRPQEMPGRSSCTCRPSSPPHWSERAGAACEDALRSTGGP